MAAATGTPVGDLQAPLLGMMEGCDVARAAGIVVEDRNPVFQLCRELIARGHHPDVELHLYRGTTLAVKVPRIGAAALCEATGIYFLKARSR